jgi:hypothetical protein
MSFFHIKIPCIDLIFGGSPSTPSGVSKGYCAGSYSRENLQPLKKFIEEEVNAV